MADLYHVEVFMPKKFSKPCFAGRLRYTHHAQQEANSDKYGTIALIEFFDPAMAQLIESEVEVFGSGAFRVVKQLWRMPLDAERDLVMAIKNDGTVKTVWVNLRSDKHRTLNRSRYRTH
jgi:hypothetical protein